MITWKTIPSKFLSQKFKAYMLTAAQLLNLLITSGHVLASPLALSFITTSTRDTWDQPLTFIVLKIPSQYLPYALLLLTLILISPHAALIQATGLAAAYLYDFSTGLYPNFGIKRNLISTPAWLKKIFGTQTTVDRPYGTLSLPGTGEPAWGLDLGWQRFGPGRTLGGEGSSAGRQRPRGCVLAVMVMGGFVVILGLVGFFLVPYGDLGVWFPSVDVGRLASGRFGDKSVTSESIK